MIKSGAARMLSEAEKRLHAGRYMHVKQLCQWVNKCFDDSGAFTTYFVFSTYVGIERDALARGEMRQRGFSLSKSKKLWTATDDRVKQ